MVDKKTLECEELVKVSGGSNDVESDSKHKFKKYEYVEFTVGNHQYCYYIRQLKSQVETYKANMAIAELGGSPTYNKGVDFNGVPNGHEATSSYTCPTWCPNIAQ